MIIRKSIQIQMLEIFNNLRLYNKTFFAISADTFKIPNPKIIRIAFQSGKRIFTLSNARTHTASLIKIPISQSNVTQYFNHSQIQ